LIDQASLVFSDIIFQLQAVGTTIRAGAYRG